MRMSIALVKVSSIRFLMLSSWTIINEISSIVNIYTPIDPISLSSLDFSFFSSDNTSKLAPNDSPSIYLNLNDWNILKYSSYYTFLDLTLSWWFTCIVKSNTLQVHTPLSILSSLKVSSVKMHTSPEVYWFSKIESFPSSSSIIY